MNSAEEPEKPAATGDDFLMGGGASPETDLLVGKRFGDCLLQRRIGAGGIGSVYLAHHVGLNKRVAVKLLPAERIGTAADVQQLLKEARTAAALEHPHVARIFDAGEAHGLCFVAMQHVDGCGLDQRLGKGKLSVREAGGIVKKVALALDAAHKLGVVHRDLKPAVILCGKDGQIRVADFGLSRVKDAGGATPEPDYRSPERVRGLPVDVRSDLYSLGATWYHLVTGRPPSTPLGEEAPRPDQVEPSVPPAVSGLIMKLLAKKPDDRFPTSEEFLRALAAVDEAGSAAAPGADSMSDLFAPSEAAAPSAPAPASSAPAAPRPPWTPEDHKGIVLGKYRPLRELRKEDDALGCWEAENTVTRGRVALWLLAADDADRVKAFYKVAEESATLKHPNILHVVECHGDTDRNGNVAHVMVVEPANLLSLEEVVSARELPPRGRLQICEQVARALDFAHQKGRTHLKISPKDVRVDPPSRAILSFHEIVASGMSDAEALDAAPFLAPEQIPDLGGTIDGRTDIYRLGAVLYWIATGKAPYAASSLDDFHRMILAFPPKAPREIDPKIDPELDRIITKAMAKERDLRYARAADLADALRKHLKTEPKSAPAAVPPRNLKKVSKARIRMVGAAVLILLAAGAGILRQRLNADVEDEGRARLEALDRFADGKYEEALSAAERALALNPGDAGMTRIEKACRRKVLEAGTLRHVGRLEEAAQEGSEAEFLESVPALVKVVGDLRKALGAESTPDEVTSVTAAGIGAFHLGQHELAAGLLETAADLKSKDPNGGLALARAYFARLVFSNAVARIMGAADDRGPLAVEWRAKMTEAMERPTRPAREGADAELADAYAALGRGELERAKAVAGALLKKSPGPAASAEALALRAWAAGGEDVADLDASIQTRPLQTIAYVIRAVRHAERGRFAEAAADLSAPAKLFPDLPILAFLRCKVRHSMGDLEGARSDLTRVRARVSRPWEFQARLDQLESALPERPK